MNVQIGLKSLFCLAAIVCLSFPATAQTVTTAPEANLPVVRVTLYTSGVGFFEREGQVDGNAVETLQFPVAEINDILKSLVVLDSGGGGIQPVTYAAQDPVDKQLQRFSVDLSDNPDQATLLNRLRGTPVTITDSAGTFTGTILGVQTKTITLPNNGGTTTESSVNLISEGSLSSIPLAKITLLKIDDPKISAEITQALGVVAQGRDVNQRPVTLSFSGHGRREVSIGYVTETPLWQTTYRLVLGKSPQLQGWALVQNTGQDDWTNVQMTLVSGRPISFIQDLYTPQYVPRPFVAPEIASAPAPQTYGSTLEPTGRTVNQPQSLFEANPTMAFGANGNFKPAPAPQAINRLYADESENSSLVFGNGSSLAQATQQSIHAQGAKLGTALFSYAIKVPVSVPRGQSAMIPFVAAPIQAEPVSIYDASVDSDHPLSGARIKNTTGLHLMGGPLTVFDSGANGSAYVGDALIDDVEPGQSRLISYAVDLGMDASSEPGAGSGQTVSIVIDKGNLQVTQRDDEETDYTFKNNSDAEQTVVVEQPYKGDTWKLLDPKAPTEQTADTLRFDVDVPAGASKKFTVRQEHPELTVYGLLDLDINTLLVYSQSGAADPSVQAALHEVTSRRQALADLQTRIDNTKSQVQEIDQGQSRIRQNMAALSHTSTLYNRYVGELNTQETTLDTLQGQLATLQGEQTEQENSLNDYVSKLTIS